MISYKLKEFLNVRNKRRLNVLSQFIVLYILVFIVPLSVLGFLTYTRYNHILEQEIGTSVLSMLSQLDNMIQLRINELNHLPVQIQKSPHLASLLNAQSISRFNTYNKYQAMKELYSYKVLNDFIDNIILYSQNDGIVITTENSTDKDTFFDKLYKYNVNDEKNFKEKIYTVDGLTIWPASPVRKYGNSYDVPLITYIRPLFMNNSSGNDTDDYNMKIIVTINADVIRRMMLDVLGNYRGYVYILNSDGQVITYAGNGESVIDDNDIGFLVSKGQGNTYTTQLGGKPVLVASLESKDLQWRYIAVISAKQVFAKVKSVEVLTIKIILVMLLIGIVLAIFLALRVYHPIKNLLHILFPNGKLPDIYKNEWDAIEKQTLSTMEKKKNLEDSIKDQIPVLKANFIKKLLKGSVVNSEEIRTMSAFLEMNMDYKSYAVMLIFIDDYNRVVSSNFAPMLDVFKNYICNAVEEFCQAVGKGYTADMSDEKIGALICFKSKDMNQNRTDLRILAQKINGFFDKYFEFTITVGLGQIYDDLLQVNRSYHQAHRAVDYKIIKGNNTVIDFEDIKIVSEYANYYSIDDEKTVIDCLRRGEIAGAEQVLNNVMVKLRNNLPSLDVARCVYFEIINTVMRAMDKVGLLSNNSGFLNVSKRLADFLKCETMDDLYFQVMACYHEICSYIESHRESRNCRLANDIAEYIDKNYNNRDLSLTMVADTFGISACYLSRFFKDHFGYNFTDYVNKRRVEISKALLQKTDKTVDSVAEEVGYGNVHSFIKMFKKYEGITPGQFKEGGQL